MHLWRKKKSLSGSDYYDMVLYEGGIIEYISGGVTYAETYLQFHEETDSFEMVVRVVVDWDFETDGVKGYYWGEKVMSYQWCPV